MRFHAPIGLAALALIAASSAHAECQARLLDDTEASFSDAAVARLRPLGIRSIAKAGHAGANGEIDHFVVIGANFSVFLEPEGDLLKEIGVVQTEPAPRVDQQKQILFAAFTLARLTGGSESAIEDQLHRSASSHGRGSWFEKIGTAAAAFTRSDNALVIKMGKPDCGQ